jgi:ABC-type transport system substrate-binding protein
VAGALEEARNSPLYSARLAQVASIRAGQGAVTITLKTPNGALPALLDVPISKGGGDRPLGTGPYVLLEQEDELVLRVRSDWRQGTGALPRQKIPLCAVRGAEELMQAFDTHSAALVATDLTGGGTVGFSGSFETMDYPTSTMVFVGINTRRGPCRDTVLCQALQRLADRQTMAEVLLARHGVPAALPAAPGCGLYPEGLAGELEFSLRTAEELLTGGGWLPGEDGVRQKGRERLELTLVVSEDNLQRVSLAERLAEDLKQAGISVTLRKLSWERYLAALAQGDFDLYLGEVRMTADFDPAALIAPGGSLNYGGYSDGEAQRLLTAFQGAAGPARREAAEALYLRLTEVPPFVVLCFKNGSVLTQWRQISGLTPTQQNIFYEFTQWNIA